MQQLHAAHSGHTTPSHCTSKIIISQLRFFLHSLMTDTLPGSQKRNSARQQQFLVPKLLFSQGQVSQAKIISIQLSKFTSPCMQCMDSDRRTPQLRWRQSSGCILERSKQLSITARSSDYSPEAQLQSAIFFQTAGASVTMK